MDNYIFAYYQKIKDGSIVVGKWVTLLYENIVAGIENGTYIFNQQKANRAIKFIETFCRHNKGKLAPKPLKLSLWEKAFISCIYGIVDESDKRIFREIALFVGRKCGKTLLASAIMAYEIYVDGEFGSEIYCVAPKLDQSDLGLGAACQEEYLGVGQSASHADTLLGALAELVETVGCGFGVVVSDEVLQHFWMCPVVIITFE